MTPIYAGPYRMFSAHVHSGAVSLRKFYLTDDEGQITRINWGPDLEDDCRAELIEAVRLLIKGLALVNKLFKVDIDNEANPIFAEYQRLGAMSATQAL